MAKMSLKWPKSTLCEIRAAWSGVFSIPGGTTGPGFKAEIRPPLFLHIFDHFLSFLTFMICAFWWNLCFCKCVKLIKCWESSFFDHNMCNVIRPYCNYMSGFDSCRGDFTGEEMCNSVVVLPSIVFDVLFFSLIFCNSCRGDSQGRILIVLSFSPLWTGVALLDWFDVVFNSVGEIHRRGGFYQLSFSPLWNRNPDFYILLKFHFVHFDVLRLRFVILCILTFCAF